MKPIVLARDNNECQIKGFPGHFCGGCLVMDHRPAKRGKHSTFFDPRNLTTVCSTANYVAEIDPFISNAIIEVVKKREGDVINVLREKSRLTKKWDEFSIRKWIDECKRYFLKHNSGAPNEN